MGWDGPGAVNEEGGGLGIGHSLKTLIVRKDDKKSIVYDLKAGELAVAMVRREEATLSSCKLL